MLLEFIQGVGLLLSLCLLQGFNVRLFHHHKRLQFLLAGLLYGAVCVIGMQQAIQLYPGVIFDSRSVILSMAGLFGGLPVALISGAIALGYRISLGGGGVYIGSTVIIVCVCSGILFRYLLQKKLIGVTPLSLFSFGLVLHATIILIFTQFPSSIVAQVMQHIALPFTLVYAFATLLLGMMLKDIEQRVFTEKALRTNENKLRSIVDGIPDALMIIDENGTYLETLSSDDHPYYPTANKIIGLNIKEVLPEETAETLQSSIKSSLELNQNLTMEYERMTDFGRRLIEARIQPLPMETDTIRSVLVLARDITDRKIKEDEISFLAFYDSLTGLPNRRLLHERIQHAMSGCHRNGTHGALLFIDIDNFKTLNDTLGHDKGDLMLKQVAHRLNSCVRETDTVARLGGDEFVVMLEDLSSIEEVAAAQSKTIGEHIISSLSQPYHITGIEHNSSASIGITLFNQGDTNSDDLMKHADIAMYQAKSAGRNTLRFFDKNMQALVSTRADLENDLREGLKTNQLILHYQAQVDRNGRTLGVEALVRWNHPKKGMISPIHFIPLAEETGLITALGNWVLNAACKQLHQWSMKEETRHLTIAVNISAKQIHQPDFIEQVLGAIYKADIEPQRLKLELTESLLLEDTEEIIQKMTILQGCGVSFSLDDFGTGYSSLAYLKRLPLHQLKIDQSFVRDILSDPNDEAISRTVVALANSLGLEVIAEGVETEEHRQKLADLGCFSYQGYLFGRPGPADQVPLHYQASKEAPAENTSMRYLQSVNAQN